LELSEYEAVRFSQFQGICHSSLACYNRIISPKERVREWMVAPFGCLCSTSAATPAMRGGVCHNLRLILYREEQLHEIEVAPLTPEETAALAAQVGAGQFNAELAVHFHYQTEGNPLF
jgi:hypothetical protein